MAVLSDIKAIYKEYLQDLKNGCMFVCGNLILLSLNSDTKAIYDECFSFVGK